MAWKMRVAIVQLGRVGLEGVSEALSLAAASGGADLYVFPENWIAREPLDPGVVEDVATRLSAELGGVVLAGLHYVRMSDGRIRSVGVAADASGRVWIACEKLHPSRSTGEAGVVEPGRLVEPFEVKGVTVGCIACVDIFYPEVARWLALRGAEILVNPASIPYNRILLWHSTLISRAAENSSYTIGVNVTGTSYPDGRPTAGGSMIASPEGEIVVALGRARAAVAVDLSGDIVREVESRRGFRSVVKARYSSLYTHI